MTLPSDAGRDIEQALQNVAVEKRRAERAAEIAARHEARIQADTEGPNGFHGRMAAVHRKAEQQHRTAARIHGAHADRLRRWAEGAAAENAQPVFMTAVADALGAGGTTVALFGSDETELLVAASNPVARTAHDLEFTLGQGPARETVRRRRAVTAAGPQLEERWPAYGPAVRRLGVRALAAVPVNVGGVALGALTVFDPPHGSAPDLVSFSAAADILAASLTPEAGDSAVEGYGTWSSLSAQADQWSAVNQAAGMVSVQCDCGVADALALIRAHAYAEDRSVESVARDIVERRLRLT